MKKSFKKGKRISVKNPSPLQFWVLSVSIFLLSGSFLLRAYSFSGKEWGEDLLREDFSPVIIQGNTLVSVSNPINPPLKVIREIPVVVTAYSSTPSQTDESPYITASGSLVEEGIVANNLLPFGTQIRIPEVFGDKIFVVEDRMNWKKGYYMVDVWLPDYSQALAFGAKRANLQVLER